MDLIHAVVARFAGGVLTGFACKACDFAGDLTEAIKHAVAHQFVVRPQP